MVKGSKSQVSKKDSTNKKYKFMQAIGLPIVLISILFLHFLIINPLTLAFGFGSGTATTISIIAFLVGLGFWKVMVDAMTAVEKKAVE